MTDPLTVAVQALALVGLAGATLLPLRALQLLRRHRALWTHSRGGRLALLLFSCLALTLLALEVQLVGALLSCLMGERCGPNRSSGTLLLASLGVWYLLFEVLAFAIFSVVRRWGRPLA